MPTHTHYIDRFFLLIVCILTIAGFTIFLSASLGLLTQNGASFGTLAVKQSISLLLGIIAFFIASKIKYLFWKKTAFIVLILSILVNLLLFIPQITLNHGGASRWLDFGFITFQPSEFLKIAFIIYMAAWIQHARERISHIKYGLFPYLLIMMILGTLLLIQRDTDTLVIIGFTGIVMLTVSGMPIKHTFLALVVMLVVIAGVLITRPYALTRVKTYLNVGSDTQGASYQINQSLIAIGSGGFFGRGFGQSVQKFGYLPQPTDDSIFAVAAEEFGFLGSSLLILLYLLLTSSLFRISSKSPDTFGSLFVTGFATLVITESFLNIAAMLGLVPLSGVPLLFVSHGGTALIIILFASGIAANVSKYAK